MGFGSELRLGPCSDAPGAGAQFPRPLKAQWVTCDSASPEHNVEGPGLAFP